MRFRGKSIRRKTGALVLVPLLSLVSVWAFAATDAIGEARAVGAASDAAEALTGPTHDVTAAVQRERRQTLVHLGDPRRADSLSELREIREETDRAVERARQGAREAGGGLRDSARDRLERLLSALDGLDQVRDLVQSNTIPRENALAAYGDVVDLAFRLLAVLQPADDPDLARQGRAVVGLAQAREHLSAEDAMVAGALAADRTDEVLGELVELMARRELAYDTYLPDLTLDDRQAHEAFWESGTGRVLAAAEESLVEGNAAAVRPDSWEETSSSALDQLTALGGEAAAHHQERYDSATSGPAVRAWLVGGLGLVVVVVSAVVAVRVGRGLTGELRGLAREARDAAAVRLPGVTRRLAVGEHVDVETEAPVLEYGSDELGQIGRSLNTLQREAVSAAVQRSHTRRGMSEVFVNLARRSQVLLHRQLNLLDGLESRTTDSENLADIVRLTHLATRMRRHAEGLVLLSGAAPARQWRKPEQLMDVVRAAVDEVEDFERVEVRRLPPLAVAGGAVADLVHLVAELLENATVFSPPHTAVQVDGERVPHGFTLEIHDRGLGMTAEALRDANRRLADPPEFEPSDTDRIGLFVIGRLAERHGIKVSLRDSPYGGTTAVTLIPGELLTEVRELPGERAGLTGRRDRPAPHGGPVELEAPVGAPDLVLGPVSGPPVAGPSPAVGHPVEHGPAHEAEAPVASPRLPYRHRTPVLVADHGRQVGEPPEPEPAPAAPIPLARPKATEERTSTGLPRRVRRPAPPSGGSGPGDGGSPGGHPEADALPDVDADEVRSRMASLQRGWQRGRQQTGDRPGPTRPDARPETFETRETPETS
ncbi:nitrate- and nitrite sensing domain-containing protein [Streptomyces sp. NPDC127098]|uniref:sensor histidine kinase n=1 Tax=Streptomyces sp. NPDC127098 TaxID=3347137 RepID=UPI003669E799